MKIKNIDAYRDGGTIFIVTEDETYCIDDRLGSNTKGSIYLGYPNKDNSNIILNQEETKKELIDAIEKYEIGENKFDWRFIAIEKLRK